MKRLFFAVMTLLLPAVALTAQQKDHRLELSIGWADQGFEKVVWHEKAEPIGLMPESYIIDAKEDYRYTQHWFVEGRYKVLKWLSVGATFDVSGVLWDNVRYTGTGTEISRQSGENFYNYILMPTVSFNWLRKEHVSLHSGLGAGVLVNTGTETDFLGRTTEAAPVYSLNLIGIRGECSRYFVALDLGATFSLVDSNQIYLAGSRLISVSVGIKL